MKGCIVAQVWVWHIDGTRMVRANAIVSLDTGVNGTVAHVFAKTTDGEMLVRVKTGVGTQGGGYERDAVQAEASSMAADLAQAIANAEQSQRRLVLIGYKEEAMVPA